MHGTQTPIEPYGDNFLFVLPVDEREHTSEKPFCWNAGCPCHEDDLLLAEVAQLVAEGLFTPQEATDFVAGRGI